MHQLKLYLRFISVYFKTLMEYRASFFTDMLVQFFHYFVTFTTIWVILNKFENISGWHYYEVMFLYNLNLFSFSLAGLFFWNAMREIESAVQHGTFDGILVRPLNPLLHLVFRHFSHNFIGNLLVSLVVFIICIANLQVIWSVAKIFWFVVVLLSAGVIQFSIMLFSGTLCFWVIQGFFIVDWVTIRGVRGFIDYPINIYNRGIQILLTCAVPYAFVNFYPAQYFLNKEGGFFFHPAIQFGTPLAAVGIFFVAYGFWKFGVQHYQSTGS